jgi:hypothetical protein
MSSGLIFLTDDRTFICGLFKNYVVDYAVWYAIFVFGQVAKRAAYSH